MERKTKDSLIKMISFVFGMSFAIIAGISLSLYPDSIWSYFILASAIIFVIVAFVIFVIISDRNRPDPSTLEQEEPIGEDGPDTEVVKVCCPACMTQQVVRGIRPFEVQCGRCGVILVIPEKR